MKVYNKSKLETATVRKIVEAARTYVIRADEKIESWGPRFVQVDEDGDTGARSDTVDIGTSLSDTAENFLDRCIWGLRWWSAVKADTRDELPDRHTDTITLHSVLEAAGVRAGLLPRKPRPPEPTELEKLGEQLKKLDVRELQWQRRIRRAETALKTIARERRVLERRATALVKKAQGKA